MKNVVGEFAMNSLKPRLVAMSGPLKGSVFPIGDSEFTLGRDEASAACLEDDLVSTRHCSIRVENEGVVLRDLESTNGTLVNGVTVATKVLEHGDRLKVGSSTFIYLEREEDLQGEPVFTDSEHDRRRSMVTVRAGRSEAGYPNTEQLQAGFWNRF